MLYTETREGKLANRMRGPFVVTKKHSEVGCQLKHVETGEIIERVHVNRLRTYAGEVEDCDSEGEEVPVEAAQPENLLDTVAGKITPGKGIIFRDMIKGNIFVGIVTNVERANNTVHLHYYIQVGRAARDLTRPLTARQKFAPEYLRKVHRRTGAIEQSRVGTFNPRSTATSTDTPVEQSIDYTKFDVLAAGFDIVPQPQSTRSWITIPSEVIEGMNARERVEAGSLHEI